MSFAAGETTKTVTVNVAGDTVVEAGAEGGLTRRRLTETGRHDVAHDALVDQFRRDARAPNGFLDGDGPELRRSEVLQSAKELAGGSANSADDHGFTHVGPRSQESC